MFEPLPIQRPNLTRRLIDPAEDPAKVVRRPTPTTTVPAAGSPLAPRPSPAPLARKLSEAVTPTTMPAPALQRALSSVSRPTVAPIGNEASTTAPGLAAPPVRRLPDTFKPTLNSGTGTNGEPVYDNASVQRLATRPGFQRTLSNPLQPLAARPEPSSEPSLRRRLVARPTPTVASTFGQSVRTLPDDSAVSPQPPQMSLRGPDAMAEQYNGREDREARRKLLSDLDSQRFRLEMIAGNPGRRGRAALEALAANAQQQAALVSGGERSSADAIQGRANRDNVLANTALQQDGEDRRTVFTVAGDAARGDADRAQARDLAAMTDATKRTEIAAAQTPKSEYRQLADGSLIQVAGDRATPVKDGSDKAVRMPIQDPNTLTGSDVLKAYGDQRAEILKLADSLAPDDVEKQLKALEQSGLGQRYQQVLGTTAKPQRDERGVAGEGAPRRVVRTGTYNGRRVVQYDDGSMGYE